MSRADPSLAVDALVFDAYGTLFDVHSLIARAEALAPGQGSRLSQLWRAKQLEYTWLTSLTTATEAPRQDFAALTAVALDYTVDALSVDLDRAARAELCEAYLSLAPFPDVPKALARLAPRPRWILSNGTLAMLEPLVLRSGLDRDIDGVLSVDAAGIFKPSPRVYQLAVDLLHLPPSQIGFVSSNCWDAIGAKAFGFTSIWINRTGAPVDRHGSPPDRVITTLGELPPLIGG
jgi:2-haloacid dehalogenase